MAEQDTWESVRRHGLLSTTALLDLYEVAGSLRERLESQRRPESVEIEHPEFGKAVIRDQKPLNEKLLLKCLRGMTPQEWYRVLNGKVFFWTERSRLERFLCAGAYKLAFHDVLVVDTASLLSAHIDAVTLCRINSGATYFMNPAERGQNTFEAVDAFPWHLPKSKAGIAEVAVNYAVPDIEAHVVARIRARCGAEDDVLWER